MQSASPDGAPVLAARLQELFGWADTPRLARGRVPVLLSLLGPNHRPFQVTDDLRNFWSEASFQIRKDLRARYSRHAWPDDPWTAPAAAKGGRHRTSSSGLEDRGSARPPRGIGSRQPDRRVASDRPRSEAGPIRDRAEAAPLNRRRR